MKAVMRRKVGFFLCFLFCLCSYRLALNADDYAGKTLEEALRLLQLQGMNILFSSDLVRPSMHVEGEPRSGTPPEILDELLTPHGLKIRSGPANTLLVVPAPPPPQVETPQLIELPQPGQEYIVVPFVTIYLTARDSDERFINDLKMDDLVLKENGRPQQILEFQNFASFDKTQERIPLSVLFLMDASQSMNVGVEGIRDDLMKEAAMELLEELNYRDQMMVIGFNQGSWTMSQPTYDRNVIRKTIETYHAVGGKTALYDTLLAGVQQMKDFAGRKVIVICSDGEDNFSKTDLKSLLRTLQSSDTMVLAFGINSKFYRRGKEALEKITEATGGYAFFSASKTELASNMKQARLAIRNQYAAGYIPPNPSFHGWRDIHLECKLRGVHLRYRKTYLF